MHVLNAAHNRIRVVTDVQLRNLTNLRALILNDNQLQRIPLLTTRHTALNTLTLSHNLIETIDNIQFLTSLKKLSLSHNSLYHIPPLGSLKLLQELRLSHNKIHTLSNSLSQNVKLKILDLGHNRIATFEDLKVLQLCTTLRQLTLSGNPIVSSEGYLTRITKLLPFLKLLDGQRIRNKKHNKTLSTSISDKKTTTTTTTTIVHFPQQNREDPQKENFNKELTDVENTSTKRTSNRVVNDRNNSDKVLTPRKRHTDDESDEETSRSHHIKRRNTKFTLLKAQHAEAQATTQLNNNNNNKVDSENSFVSEEMSRTVSQSTLLEESDTKEKKELNVDSVKEDSTPESEREKANVLHESGIHRVYVHQRQRHSLFDVNELIKNSSVEALGWDTKS